MVDEPVAKPARLLRPGLSTEGDGKTPGFGMFLAGQKSCVGARVRGLLRELRRCPTPYSGVLLLRF
jgi:hypothetical protein